MASTRISGRALAAKDVGVFFVGSRGVVVSGLLLDVGTRAVGVQVFVLGFAFVGLQREDLSADREERLDGCGNGARLQRWEEGVGAVAKISASRNDWAIADRTLGGQQAEDLWSVGRRKRRID